MGPEMAACAPALSAEPVEPDPVSTGVGSRSCHARLAIHSIVLNLFASAALLLVRRDRHCRGRSEVLEEVIVTATLREQSLLATPVSITVLNERTLQDAGRQHFEDVLAAVPNLNWAGGTSRPRFFQIRGIGEREQYEGAPNPSGRLPDRRHRLQRHRHARDAVRRRPHRGAARAAGNALRRERARGPDRACAAQEPADELGFATEASYGEYASESIGAVATGPVDALNSSWRVAVQRYRSDGYRRDVFLQRDDTNDRDELTARAKWRWQPSEDTTVDLTWLHAKLDNGYDGWSIDNTRVSLGRSAGQGCADRRRRFAARRDRRRIARATHGHRRGIGLGQRIQLRRRLGQRTRLGAVHV